MIGKLVSHYQILEKLGEGGMGVVYKAEDTRLDRFVALKFLPPYLGQAEEEKKRFIHEAKATSALDHPNICTVHEIDETEDGQTFIVMACYEGEILKDKIQRGPLKVEDAINIAVQIAQGLEKAHQKEIVHRDIKPANILITTDGVVKILDFGLAKLRGRTVLTKEGTTLGTVSYMSPEQTQGAEVDCRTDIWALGTVLYEMVTGQLPFKGDYEQAVMYSIMNEDVAPLTGLRTGVPMELERIVNKALAKSPDDRYQHLDELCVDLKSISKALESGRLKHKQTRPGPSRKERTYLYGGIAVLILLLIAGGIYLRQRMAQRGAVPVATPEMVSTTRWQNSIAVLPFANISADPEQEYFSDGMTEQIITNLSQLQALKVIARTSVMKFKNTEKTIPEIGKELKVAYVLEGSVRKSGNRIRVTAQLIKADEGFHLWANDYDRELNDVFAVQDDVSVAIATSLLEALSVREVLNIKTKRPSNVQAYEFYIKGQYFHLQKYFGATYNLEYFKKSEEMFKKAIELDSNYALAYAGLADLYDTYGIHPKITTEEKRNALRMEQKYIEIALRLEPNLAEVQVANGWVRGAIGDIDERYKSFKKAVQLNSNYAYGYYSLGRFFRFRGLYHQGIKLLSRAIELDPLDAKSYTVRAINYYHIGEFEKATSDYEKALEIEPDHLMALSNYGELLVVLRKLDKAEELLARCKKINPDYGFNRILRALILAAKGERARALKAEIADRYRVMIYALLGMKEEVIEYLNNKPVFTYLTLKNLPLFNSLRDDVRFEKILAKQEKKYRENLKKYGR